MYVYEVPAMQNKFPVIKRITYKLRLSIKQKLKKVIRTEQNIKKFLQGRGCGDLNPLDMLYACPL